MKRAEVPSYPVSIFMAGELRFAKAAAQEYCDCWPFCVTVTATTYIYEGGSEDGFVIGLINYPRFPKKPKEIWRFAEEVAFFVREKLGQQSYTIQAPDKTVWISHRAEDTPA